MNDPLIEGGYILLSRKIIESEIFKKPPLYLKVWVYILSCAQHKPYKQLEKGQLFTSIPEIQDACSYMVGYRKEIPTKDQIFNILAWLRSGCEDPCESNDKSTMITTTKATHGILINIDKYAFYQNSKNYESNDDNNNETDTKAVRKQRQANNINKNEKNEKNVNNNIKTYSENPELNTAILEFIEFRNSKQMKSPLTEHGIDLLIKKLSDLSPDAKTQIAIINQSIVGGWKGVFPLKDDKKVVQIDQPKQNQFNRHPTRGYTAEDYSAIEKALLNKGL